MTTKGCCDDTGCRVQGKGVRAVVPCSTLVLGSDFSEPDTVPAEPDAVFEISINARAIVTSNNPNKIIANVVATIPVAKSDGGDKVYRVVDGNICRMTSLARQPIMTHPSPRL